MKSYEDKLLENERAMTRWMIRLKRASNAVDKLRRQKANLLRAQAKALNKEADKTDEDTTGQTAIIGAITEPSKPKKRGKPERRINL